MPWSKLFEIFDHVHVFDPVEPRAKHAVAGGGVVPAAYDQRGEWEMYLVESERVRELELRGEKGRGMKE